MKGPANHWEPQRLGLERGRIKLAAVRGTRPCPWRTASHGRAPAEELGPAPLPNPRACRQPPPRLPRAVTVHRDTDTPSPAGNEHSASTPGRPSRSFPDSTGRPRPSGEPSSAAPATRGPAPRARPAASPASPPGRALDSGPAALGPAAGGPSSTRGAGGGEGKQAPRRRRLFRGVSRPPRLPASGAAARRHPLEGSAARGQVRQEPQGPAHPAPPAPAAAGDGRALRSRRRDPGPVEVTRHWWHLQPAGPAETRGRWLAGQRGAGARVGRELRRRREAARWARAAGARRQPESMPRRGSARGLRPRPTVPQAGLLPMEQPKYQKLLTCGIY